MARLPLVYQKVEGADFDEAWLKRETDTHHPSLMHALFLRKRARLESSRKPGKQQTLSWGGRRLMQSDLNKKDETQRPGPVGKSRRLNREAKDRRDGCYENPQAHTGATLARALLKARRGILHADAGDAQHGEEEGPWSHLQKAPRRVQTARRSRSVGGRRRREESRAECLPTPSRRTTPWPKTQARAAESVPEPEKRTPPTRLLTGALLAKQEEMGAAPARRLIGESFVTHSSQPAQAASSRP